MKIGLNTGYWFSGPPTDVVEQITEAERLGFDSIWTAEAYGSDALTPLAWWGASTTTPRLGTAIMQMSARTPTATAMAALTLDHLSGGRFILGLGASGPQVVEGWYGQPYPRPLARTREYIEIVRQVFAREDPVTFQGDHFQIPYAGGTGLGKALKPTVHPLRTDLPIMLAAEGPKNVALSAEIADGWLPFWFSPKSDSFYRAALAEGFARPGSRHQSLDTFEVVSLVPTVIADDVEACADILRPMLALYIGGMGAKGANFHYEVLARMGYEAECAEIQKLYLDGYKSDAIAAVPTALVEDVALIGPRDKVADEASLWKDSVITTALIAGPASQFETIKEILS
ncbi:LLM class F420-dependent oxidoreductase [Nocardia salmonicida]|uniref:LLM class F420-dependent oxidoreductase n=1 Tax=Nocardia salmonicida TaxID=53431 RepID=UPI0036252286